jgi:hypothetical protein
MRRGTTAVSTVSDIRTSAYIIKQHIYIGGLAMHREQGTGNREQETGNRKQERKGCRGSKANALPYVCVTQS